MWSAGARAARAATPLWIGPAAAGRPGRAEESQSGVVALTGRATALHKRATALGTPAGHAEFMRHPDLSPPWEIVLPKTIGGWLDLSGCDLKGIVFPKTIGGGLYLSGCDLKGIVFPKTIGGGLYLSGCDLKGIVLPKGVEIIQ